MSVKIFLFFSLFLFGIWSCSQTPQSQNLFAGAQTITLTGEFATIKLPTYFTRSSEYRLMEDIPYLKKDTTFFQSIVSSLKAFTFEDSDLDILVDTTSELRCLIIADGPRFEIDADAGRLLNKQISGYFRQIDEDNLFLEIHKIDSKLKLNNNIELLKYKYEFVNTRARLSYYRSFFFLSNPSRSLLIIEISVEGNDVEDYLWTVKG